MISINNVTIFRNSISMFLFLKKRKAYLVMPFSIMFVCEIKALIGSFIRLNVSFVVDLTTTKDVCRQC